MQKNIYRDGFTCVVLFVFCSIFLFGCAKTTVVTSGKKGTDRPYNIGGKMYYPLSSSQGYLKEGTASWYGKDYHGRKTANGETYDMYAMTAAHPVLPMNTRVRVTNLENNRSVTLRINDRGPFVNNRIIDVSYAAARALDMQGRGLVRVRVETIRVTSKEKARPQVQETDLGSTHAKVKTQEVVTSSHTQPKGGTNRAGVVSEKTTGNNPASSRVMKGGTTSQTPATGATAHAAKTRPSRSAGWESAGVNPKASLQKPGTSYSPPPQKTVPVKEKKAASGQGYYVQVGAYSDKLNAISQQKNLKFAGFPESRLVKMYKKGGSIWRVQAGAFSNRTQAERAVTELSVMYPTCFIVD